MRDCIDWKVPIECGQLAAPVNGEAQKKDVSDMGMGDDLVPLKQIADANILDPERVSSDSAELPEQRQNCRYISRPVRIARMASDPHEAVLGQRAS